MSRVVPILELAQRFLDRGFSVIPVPRPSREADGKTPVIPWKRYQTELPTTGDLARWFAGEPMNLAIITGAVSGVVVVDVDAGEAVRWVQHHLPDTPWQTLTAKGVHLWFAHPGGDVRGKVRLRTDAGKLPLDIRADGNYVMAPGSVHATGAVYRFVGDWRVPRARLPVFSRDWLPLVTREEQEEVTNQGSRRSSTPRGNSPLDALTRARAYLAAVPRPEIGHGSDFATFTAACRLVRGFNLSTSDAEDLLVEWAGGRPGWDRDWIAKKVNSAFHNGQEQFGALL